MGKGSSSKVSQSTYGDQKKRHYVKFMSIVLPGSYVTDTLGSFHGAMNYVNITEDIVGTGDGILSTKLGSFEFSYLNF